MEAGDTEPAGQGRPEPAGEGGRTVSQDETPATGTPDRPLAVAVTAVLYVIGGVIGFLAAIGLIVGGTLVGAFLPIGGGLAAAIGAIIGVVVLLLAFVSVGVGWGIWQGKDWGRAVAVVFSGIGLLLGAIAVLGSLASGEVGDVAFPTLIAAFHGAVIYFFTRNYVENWFNAMPG